MSVLDDARKDKGADAPEDLWIRLGRAAEAAGDRDKAIDAYRKVYYESPLSMQAIDAQSLLERLETASLSDRLKLELAARNDCSRRGATRRRAPGLFCLRRSPRETRRSLLRCASRKCDYYLVSLSCLS
jgi:hypothetical protein